jgi:hypothetical protein
MKPTDHPGRSALIVAMLISPSLLLGACNQDDPPGAASDGDASVAAGEFLLPWAAGNSWTYQVTDDGETSTKAVTVGALEEVGGSGPNQDMLANRTVTRKGELDETVSWQNRVGERVIRYREQSFKASTGDLDIEEHWDPSKLHVDGSADRIVAGAHWTESYEETKIRGEGGTASAQRADQWSVKAADEEVTVPAGTFRAVVFEKQSTDTKTYWYVSGVGKVKETGGQTEELVSYTVVP